MDSTLQATLIRWAALGVLALLVLTAIVTSVWSWIVDLFHKDKQGKDKSQ